VEMLDLDAVFWRGRRVFLTGHTGFKGAWLNYWLLRMGAVVTGYGLPPSTSPCLFGLLKLPPGHFADIRDVNRLSEAVRKADPEIVLHLAAQALVRPSFSDPVGTFSTNVVGTAAVLDAVRMAPSVRAVVVITSDKCYANHEWAWGYRETDALGGHDPYSASKAATEIVTSAMRQSYFAPYRSGGHAARIATVRAGNVIGGGDWSKDRLVPDIVRASEAGMVTLRNPHAVRPWQHVLEPLAAYLGLAQKLCSDRKDVDEAFNIGPAAQDSRPVLEVANALVAALGGRRIAHEPSGDQLHEAGLLRLDSSKAYSVLGWRPRWDFERAIDMTASWYAGYARGEDVSAMTDAQLNAFEADSPYTQKTTVIS
jgi:CDP-glucose 4,6-dehydratase